MHLHRITTIAHYTIIDCIKHHIILLGIFCWLSVMALSYVTGSAMIGSLVKIVLDGSLLSFQLFIYSFILFLVAPFMQRQITYQMPQLFLTKCTRIEYILGTIAGFYLIIAVEGVLLYSATILFLKFITTEYHFYLAPGYWFLILEGMWLTTIALLFSLFCSTTVTCVATLSCYLLANINNIFFDLVIKKLSGIAYVVGTALYYAVPDFSLLAIKSAVVHQLPIQWNYILYATLYMFAYTAISSLWCVFIFRKKIV